VVPTGSTGTTASCFSHVSASRTLQEAEAGDVMVAVIGGSWCAILGASGATFEPRS
jgi:hypothetical protein